MSSKWPFGMSIDPNIVHIDRIASSTAQNTLEDLRSAKGFRNNQREKIVDMIKTQEANTCLIAAAPDLYEALEGVITAMEGLGHGPFDAERAALAKARGEQ
jgi:hypothetical protein